MDREKLIKELSFKAVRSSGAGGQHVNKTASKVEVSFDIQESSALSETEKFRVRQKLASRITQDGNLMLSCSESRSQHRNKAIVIERLIELVRDNLKVAKKRKKTRPSKNSIERRLNSKKKNAFKKSNRKSPPLD